MLFRTFFRSLTIAGIFATPLNSRFRKQVFGGVKKCLSNRERSKKGPKEHQTCWISSNAIFVWGFFLSRHPESVFVGRPAVRWLPVPKMAFSQKWLF
jgi:hypothetical protein